MRVSKQKPQKSECFLCFMGTKQKYHWMIISHGTWNCSKYGSSFHVWRRVALERTSNRWNDKWKSYFMGRESEMLCVSKVFLVFKSPAFLWRENIAFFLVCSMNICCFPEICRPEATWNAQNSKQINVHRQTYECISWLLCSFFSFLLFSVWNHFCCSIVQIDECNFTSLSHEHSSDCSV